MEESQIQQDVASSDQPKMLTQDQVNKIVAHEKMKAAESAKKEVEQRYQRDLEALNSQREQHVASTSRDIDANAIYQQVQERFNRDQAKRREELEQQQLKQKMTEVANSYLQKISQGKTAYEDFEEVTKDFDPTAFPQLTFLLSAIDNAAEVLYDISKNPMKLAGLDRLAERNPRQAQNELMKLSKSIMDNRQAQTDAQGQNVSEPLNRLQPSRVSGSNGNLSVTDLRKQPWLRG